MKQAKTVLRHEFEVALAYYKRTVWNHVSNLPLAGAQFGVAFRAWQRLDTAQRAWSDGGMQSCRDLPDWKQKVMTATVDIQAIRPRRLERDSTITPELLATLASARLGTPKPKSICNAVEDAHRILIGSRNYLKELPEPKEKSAQMLEAYNNHVSFAEVLDSSGKPNCFPLLPTVQANRNDGILTARALKMALKRHASGAPKKIQQEIREALKNNAISCRLLEEIRWKRFRRHFKP
jgi:hypothetical protein